MQTTRLDETLRYAIEQEGKLELGAVTNYGEVRDDIARRLRALPNSIGGGSMSRRM